MRNINDTSKLSNRRFDRMDSSRQLSCVCVMDSQTHAARIVGWRLWIEIWNWLDVNALDCYLQNIFRYGNEIIYEKCPFQSWLVFAWMEPIVPFHKNSIFVLCFFLYRKRNPIIFTVNAIKPRFLLISDDFIIHMQMRRTSMCVCTVHTENIVWHFDMWIILLHT